MEAGAYCGAFVVCQGFDIERCDFCRSFFTVNKFRCYVCKGWAEFLQQILHETKEEIDAMNVN